MKVARFCPQTHWPLRWHWQAGGMLRVAFWDKLWEAFGCVKGKLRKVGCCSSGEYDDYADWDAE